MPCCAPLLAGLLASLTASEVERLVRQLGSDHFRERARATRRLDAVGEPALAALRRAAASTDPETSSRARVLAEDIGRRREARLTSTFKGHVGPVRGVAFSPDGRLLASAGEDGAVRVWELARWKELRHLGHPESAFAVAFTPDGRLLTGGGQAGPDFAPRLRDVRTGAEVRRFEGHTRRVRGLAVSSDGKLVVSGSEDNTVRLWDVATGKEVKRLEGHGSMVFSVAISPDGRRVLSGGGGGDPTMRLWDAGTGEQVKVFAHRTAVWCVRFDPAGGRALSAGWDMAVRVWDTDKWAQAAQFKGHRSVAHAAAFLPRGRVLSGSGDHFGHNGRSARDNSLRLWDTAGKELARFAGHEDAVECLAVSADGRLAASGGFDGVVRLWKLP